ncbi:MAG: hypothetical protein AAF711_06020 [Planctomycetota bacterium]
MHKSQVPITELYREITAYRGQDAYGEVLERWLRKSGGYKKWLSRYRDRTNHHWSAAKQADLWVLYALYRVTSSLLLRFQAGRGETIDYPEPSLPIEGFQIFHEQLGFQTTQECKFHPFYHEVLSVSQAEDPQAPIKIDQCIWPCLMLGDMMYCRAGCEVTGGKNHIDKTIAESSTLYWTFCRSDKPCDDQSHGWGHNSQWRTNLRRDYRTHDQFFYNVDGDQSLNSLDCETDGIAHETMIEVVQNRCLIKSSFDGGELYPYPYCYTEKS